MNRTPLWKKCCLTLCSTLVFVLLCEIGARIAWYQGHGPYRLAIQNVYDCGTTWVSVHLGAGRHRGWTLNQQSWQAAYQERGLPVPPEGPREWYQMDRVKVVRDPSVFWSAANVSIPGKVETDGRGVQSIGPRDAPLRLVFVGGSVAFGGYASSLTNTYFAQFQRHLSKGDRIRVDVLAAGGWWSEMELAAVAVRLVPLKPDVVVFLDGLNDLTQNLDIPMEKRPAVYASNMRLARDILLTNTSAVVVFAVQPYLGSKLDKSKIEREILSLPPASSRLSRNFTNLYTKMAGLAAPPRTHFIDCSHVFDHEAHTTFADFWHFADPGHEILGRFLAEHLQPILDRQLRQPAVSEP